MTISLEVETQILRYYHAERWRVGTIACQLGVHHSVVRRVLAKHQQPGASAMLRATLLDTYLPFVQEKLENFPELTASRLYYMVRERGYCGGEDHFRHVIGQHRPRRKSEAYLRLRTLPGEQSQVDWGHFGHLEIGRARRALMAFVMVLSYSRKIYLRFFLDARMENFLRGHLGAFHAWDGVPRVLLYDNLKSAVLERQGQAIRFNPTLLEFAGHYRFEPRPVAVARGNEKGRVERSIRYIRDNFFAARTFANLDDLNRQAMDWCNGPASERRCPEQPTQTVEEIYQQETARLLKLPDNPYPVMDRVEVSVGKTPYIRFDLNDYSIPHTHVRRTLTVLADPDEVRIVDGAEILACHPRSYDKGAQIEQSSHIDALVQEKHAARQHRGIDKLTRAVPSIQALLEQAAERGDNIGSITSTLLDYLDHYGASEMEMAVSDALARGVPHPNAVRLALERRREQRDQPPPLATLLPNHIQQRDVVVRTHRLDSYDQLKESHDD